MWWVRWIGLLLGAFLPLQSYSFINQINELRVKSNPNYCQVEFEAAAPIQYQLLTLSHPDRLVIDIKNARLLKLFKSTLIQGTPIEDIRSGAKKNNSLRIVFDLKNKVIAQAVSLPPDPQNAYYHLRLRLYPNGSMPVMQATPLVIPPTKKIRHAIANTQFTPDTDLTLFPTRAKQVIVVIDPGHGGKDPGASGAYGAREKNIVLQISRYLQKDINRIPGFRAYLTRDSDYYLTLRERLAIARRYKADMFIAIHADAYHGSTAHGASVFALSQRGATSEAARWLAKRENESELMGGVDLTDKNNLLKSVLINLSQTATVRASLDIGQQLIQALGDVGSLHHHRMEQAAFVVLKSPDIPSLLVETGFISNPREADKLTNARYQKNLAAALTQGIRAYFLHSPPRGTWLSQQQFTKAR